MHQFNIDRAFRMQKQTLNNHFFRHTTFLMLSPISTKVHLCCHSVIPHFNVWEGTDVCCSGLRRQGRESWCWGRLIPLDWRTTKALPLSLGGSAGLLVDWAAGNQQEKKTGEESVLPWLGKPIFAQEANIKIDRLQWESGWVKIIFDYIFQVGVVECCCFTLTEAALSVILLLLTPFSWISLVFRSLLLNFQINRHFHHL